ncbi:cora-domain-containing protein [Aspergillus campestris IBT 28561]|uniref:Cora-domain-containing protein n=1 Tax=Aspergillus campestris (strain IBT 28561) TaxID=1392248 RepID=A0A2I1D600_ASPC2|nr:cora-domain-containing protein [Aspergillus campestris IBT 28561]PKY05283.1 cora-domain-containing protein [Aspergillus campestris IBT 28561]
MPRPSSDSRRPTPSSAGQSSHTIPPTDSRPSPGRRSTTLDFAATAGARPEDPQTPSKTSKRKKNRNRKRRNRRQSFLAAEGSHTGAAAGSVPEPEPLDIMAADQPKPQAARPFYKLSADLSSTSLESEALLDHRDQLPLRPRRESRLAQSFRPGSSSTVMRPETMSRNIPSGSRTVIHAGDESDDAGTVNDRTPLIRPTSSSKSNRPRYGTEQKPSQLSVPRRPSSTRTTSSRRSPRNISSPTFPEPERDYDVNNPPSMPTSPKLGPEMGYDDAVVTGAEYDFAMAKSIENRMDSLGLTRPQDMVIDVDDEGRRPRRKSAPSPPVSPHRHSSDGLHRRRTFPAEEDVCFPAEAASELAEEEGMRPAREGPRRHRRRRREWPDLSVLEEWSREEKEERIGDFRTKKISEPMLVEGRLRPQYRLWRMEEEDAPYRFTYFNEELQSTIHAQTISELVQPGGSFQELFIPEPPELDVSSDDDDDLESGPDEPAPVPEHPRASMSGLGDAPNNHHHHYHHHHFHHPAEPLGPDGKLNGRPSVISEAFSDARTSANASPSRRPGTAKPKRYGPRPTFWLDVLSPTDAEMRVIAKAFGIHALTAEDIMMQEAREKVELFRHYYFVNYRTFEQNPNSEQYLQPVNMYVVVFREGVLSFHFSQTPHPANVRRRIRQLMDYLILSSDWISYALIDDITDVFGPLIQAIEDEVDEIDGKIMQMHPSDLSSNREQEKATQADRVPPSLTPGEMLRRVGICRKKVMGMYRLLSNKADVVKGFAKRCNEQWEVAPKSEIGLYLGDIQDHLMTMTSSLTYYETLLSRAHSNYLAQINILMNERQEQTADVLGKLTVLGTIVLPLNIICGMWGMNVKVPGQDVDSLSWFYSITGGLILFALASFSIAKRVYKIV